ncbi:MAG: hypothetical protein ABJB86_14755 [Bacteroidota bacterium]
MPISLDKFRAKLVIKILYARSTEETERFINGAISAMRKTKTNGQVIANFVERVISQLGTTQSLITNSTHGHNIMTAIDSLLRVRELSNPSLG